MKSIRLFVLIYLLATAATGWSQGFLRTYNISGINAANSKVLSAIPTPDGGFLFFAETNTTQAWLVKTDPLGEAQWTREVQLDPTDLQADLYITPDGHYALANYVDNSTADNSLALFDVQGNLINKVDFTGFARIVMTSDGFLVSNRVDVNAYKLFRLDWQGNIVWEKTEVTKYLGLFYDMTATQDGGLCLMVAYDSLGGRAPKLIKTNSDGDVEWERVYRFQGLDFYGRIIQNTQGQFVCTNQFLNIVGSMLFVADSNGDSLWSKPLELFAFGLCETTDHGYAISGEAFFQAGIDLVKTDAAGNTLFTKGYDAGISFGAGYDVHPLSDGGMVISGILGVQAALVRTDANGNIYPNFIAGKVAFDQNHDCQIGSGELPLKNWTIVATEASGQEYYATSNDSGFYELNVNIGNYSVEVHLPGPLWESCNGQQMVDLSAPPDTVQLNFPVQDSVLCSLLDVAVSTPFLRRCFDGNYYVSWCNQGTAAAFNAFIEIVLPPELDFVSATPVNPVQTGDTLRFDIGTVGWGECGTLQFKVNVDCDSTVLWQTLCVEARIFPDTICYETQNWSGARVAVSARCIADTAVEFHLRNMGPVSTQTLDYIITEDLVVLMQGSFDLAANEAQVIVRDANGTLQRIEAEQEPGFPFNSFVAAVVEGCGNPPLSYGLVNQFPLADASPFTDIECREVVGSYDPNDKQGFPVGYGPEHAIEPGTDITYLIRFQNTGTDTAFTVVIRDTLSAWLDPASVRPGAASHPYTWELTGAGALAFYFENILLPDSNVNEPASHGFVQFRMAQRAGVPLGAVIKNEAAIYFDYNAPVITNTTLHTIGKDFYTLSIVHNPSHGLFPVTVAPNPFHEQATITLPEALPGETTFRLLDQNGSVVRTRVFSGKTLEFSPQNLSPGMYYFEIKDNSGRTRSSGKMILQ